MRKKIAACVARGGMPDEDAPDDPESTRYRCSLQIDQNDTVENESAVTLKGAVGAEDAMRAFKGIDPMLAQAHSSKAADPLALVREQLASYSAPASEQAPGTPSTVRGEMQFAFVSFTYLYQYRILFFASGGRPKPKIKAKANAPLSDVSLASKTLPEKVQALRAGLGFSLCFPFLINNHACFQFFIC